MNNTATPSSVAPTTRFERGYALGLLTFIYVLSFLDRQILSILLQPIKEEFSLSDTQLGLLSGLAFAVFYTGFAIPLASIGDRGSRRRLISAVLALWSAMTALSGLAVNFAMLLAARIGVAVGEAGCNPSAHSLIADYYPPDERPRAMSIFHLGPPIGLLIGFSAGGWINQLFDWRVAFLVAGVPGIAVAVVARLTLPEPVRGGYDQAAATEPAPPFAATARFLWRCRSFRQMIFASGLQAFVTYGLATWIPTFFIRSHGLSTGEIGTWVALVTGIAGGAGTLTGGWLGARWGRRDRRWFLWLPALGNLVGFPFLCLVFLAGAPFWALVFYVLPTFLGSLWSGPVHAASQSVVRPRMRAVASAVVMFVINLIGLGLGPLLIGVLSDALTPAHGDEALRYALLTAVALKLWSALHFAWGARSVRADLAAVA